MTSPIDEFWPRPGATATQATDLQQTQPIVPPAAAEPPPSGLHADAEAPPAAPEPQDWQSRYEHQAKRTKIFMATTAAAVAALIGSLFFGFAASSTAGAGTLSPTGAGGQLQGPGGQFPGGGSPLPGGGMQAPGQGGVAPHGFGHHDGDGLDDSFDDDFDRGAGSDLGSGTDSGQSLTS